MTECTRSVLIKILLRHLYRAPSGVSRGRRRAMGRAELKYHTNSVCWGLDLHAEMQSWRSCAFRGGTPAPLCQRSEVNGDISPFCGLQGRDIELLIEPRITHEQITTSHKPSRKVLGTDSLHLHLGGARLNKAEGRMRGGLQVPVGQGSGPGKVHRRWLRNSRCVSLPLHGTRVRASAQADGHREAGRRGGPSPTAGELRPAVRVYSLQGVAGAEHSSFRWMIKWVAQQEVKQLEFLPHYHGNLISGIMRY